MRRIDQRRFDFGTVMNLEPSLFVYFAVPFVVGDAGCLCRCGGRLLIAVVGRHPG